TRSPKSPSDNAHRVMTRNRERKEEERKDKGLSPFRDSVSCRSRREVLVCKACLSSRTPSVSAYVASAEPVESAIHSGQSASQSAGQPASQPASQRPQRTPPV